MQPWGHEGGEPWPVYRSRRRERNRRRRRVDGGGVGASRGVQEGGESWSRLHHRPINTRTSTGAITFTWPGLGSAHTTLYRVVPGFTGLYRVGVSASGPLVLDAEFGIGFFYRRVPGFLFLVTLNPAGALDWVVVGCYEGSSGSLIGYWNDPILLFTLWNFFLDVLESTGFLFFFARVCWDGLRFTGFFPNVFGDLPIGFLDWLGTFFFLSTQFVYGDDRNRFPQDFFGVLLQVSLSDYFFPWTRQIVADRRFYGVCFRNTGHNYREEEVLPSFTEFDWHRKYAYRGTWFILITEVDFWGREIFAKVSLSLTRPWYLMARGIRLG